MRNAYHGDIHHAQTNEQIRYLRRRLRGVMRGGESEPRRRDAGLGQVHDFVPGHARRTPALVEIISLTVREHPAPTCTSIQGKRDLATHSSSSFIFHPYAVMRPEDLDIYDLLCLDRSRVPYCPKWNGQSLDKYLPDHIAHIRAVAPEHLQQDLNSLICHVMPQGEVRLDRLEKTLNDSLGRGSWDCCVEWDFDTHKAWFEERNASKATIKGAKKLQQYAWPQVLEALDVARAERQDGKRNGCDQEKPLVPSDCDRALEILHGKGKRKRDVQDGQHGSEDAVTLEMDNADSAPESGKRGRMGDLPPRTLCASSQLTGWITDEDLDKLKSGRLLEEEGIRQVVHRICQLKPDQFSLGYAGNRNSPKDTAAIVPILAGEDHWILGVLKTDSAVLYDPKGFPGSDAGVNQLRNILPIRNTPTIKRSSPIFQQQRGDSQILLLIMAFLLVAGVSIPPDLDLRMWSCLFFCMLAPIRQPDGEHDIFDYARSTLSEEDRQMVDELVTVDISSWDQHIRLKDVVQRIEQVVAESRRTLEVVLESAETAMAALSGLRKDAETAIALLCIGRGYELCVTWQQRIREQLSMTQPYVLLNDDSVGPLDQTNSGSMR